MPGLSEEMDIPQEIKKLVQFCLLLCFVLLAVGAVLMTSDTHAERSEMAEEIEDDYANPCSADECCGF